MERAASSGSDEEEDFLCAKSSSLLLSAALLAGLLVVPAAAAGKPYIRQVVAGRPAVMAVTSSGDVYAWGSNDLGLIDRESQDGKYGWLKTEFLS